MELRTKRLLIRPFLAEDEEIMLRLLTDSKIKETFMIPDSTAESRFFACFCAIKICHCPRIELREPSFSTTGSSVSLTTPASRTATLSWVMSLIRLSTIRVT